jgi:hypothetical protein
MSVLFVRASIVALLFCAACSGSASTAATGSGGATASSSESSSSASSGAGGSTPGTMACELTITEATGANVELTSFSAPVGQGNTTHKSGHPIDYGFGASATTMTTIALLNIVVSGDALTAGATYTIANDNDSIIELTINNVVTNSGLHDWIAATGSTVKVDAIGPGPVDHYKNVTYALSDVTMEPSATATMNKATGTFKLSGKCAGNIQDLP